MNIIDDELTINKLKIEFFLYDKEHLFVILHIEILSQTFHY